MMKPLSSDLLLLKYQSNSRDVVKTFLVGIFLVAGIFVNQPKAIGVQIFTNESDFKASLGSFETYDFDAFEPGTILENQIPGIEFDSAVISLGSFGGTFNSPQNVVLNQNYSTGGSIVINFTEQVFGVGLFNTSIVDRERFDIFDADDNLLGSIELPENVVNFGGFISDIPIAKAEIVGITPTNGSIFIDDLTVGGQPTSTPEPSLVLGIIAAFGTLIKVKNSKQGN